MAGVWKRLPDKKRKEQDQRFVDYRAGVKIAGQNNNLGKRPYDSKDGFRGYGVPKKIARQKSRVPDDIDKKRWLKTFDELDQEQYWVSA